MHECREQPKGAELITNTVCRLRGLQLRAENYYGNVARYGVKRIRVFGLCAPARQIPPKRFAYGCPPAAQIKVIDKTAEGLLRRCFDFSGQEAIRNRRRCLPAFLRSGPLISTWSCTMSMCHAMRFSPSVRKRNPVAAITRGIAGARSARRGARP